MPAAACLLFTLAHNIDPLSCPLCFQDLSKHVKAEEQAEKLGAHQPPLSPGASDEVKIQERLSGSSEPGATQEGNGGEADKAGGGQGGETDKLGGGEGDEADKAGGYEGGEADKAGGGEGGALENKSRQAGQPGQQQQQAGAGAGSGPGACAGKQAGKVAPQPPPPPLLDLQRKVEEPEAKLNVVGFSCNPHSASYKLRAKFTCT